MPRIPAALTAAITVAAMAVPAHAAVAQSAVVTTDCTSSRIQETVVNRTSAATTFTLTWPGVGTWTAVARRRQRPLPLHPAVRQLLHLPHDNSQGFDQTDTGTLNCSNALSVRAAMDCGSPHRLRLILENNSPASRTFTVAWPGRPTPPGPPPSPRTQATTASTGRSRTAPRTRSTSPRALGATPSPARQAAAWALAGQA